MPSNNLKESHPDKAFIYALVDPDTGVFKYVGQTWNIGKRYREHLKHNEYWNNDKAWWIFVLATRGKSPGIVLLEEVPYEKRFSAETEWTNRLLNAGFRLVNLRRGSRPETKHSGTVYEVKIGFRRRLWPYRQMAEEFSPF